MDVNCSRSNFRNSSYEEQCAIMLVRLENITGKSERPATVKHLWNLTKQALQAQKELISTHSASANSIAVNKMQSISASTLLDSGASDTLIRVSDKNILANIFESGPIFVGLPNGSSIASIASGIFSTANLPTIPAHIFSDSHLERSLISLSDYTNRGCTVQLDSSSVSMTYNGKTVKVGSKLHDEKLWKMDFSDLSLLSAASVENSTAANMVTHQYNAEYVAYTHACFGSPTNRTFYEAVRKGFILGLPRLTAKLIASNPPSSVPAAQGHLDLHRQGLRSTKVKSKKRRHLAPPATVDDPDLEQIDTPNGDLFVHSIEVPVPRRYSADGTGCLPITSSRGSNYLLVSVFNSYVHVEPMVSRSAADHLKAHRATLEFFRSAGTGHAPCTLRIDNEVSGTLLAYFRTENITVERVAPTNHRTLQAERAIRDVKNHLTASMCT